jgi:imidazoleglycerol-phosphate dehydratase
MPRIAAIQRKTAETDIELSVNLDGSGVANVATGVGFFDHMLTLLAKHAAIDLTVKAAGDLHVDQHHTVEDTGICFGQAVKQALGDKAGIRRYGHFTLPMEETLATTAIDLSGRYYLVFQATFPTAKIGDFDSELVAGRRREPALQPARAGPLRPQQSPHQRSDL